MTGHCADYNTPAPRLPDSRGELAQLGERWLCKPEVTGSNPVFSTMKNTQVTIKNGDENIYRYRVVIYRDEDDVFIAKCPALPGCVTDGATFEEALEMIKDAVRVYIGSKIELGESLPQEDDVFEGVVSVSL